MGGHFTGIRQALRAAATAIQASSQFISCRPDFDAVHGAPRSLKPD
jgi:hypothetical protein